MGAIFNKEGRVVYLPPPPEKVPILIDDFFVYINSDKEKFPLINSFIAHLIFERIHPFLDGNGRVGRLLILSVCQAKGFNFNIHIPFEEGLEKNREEYYYQLDQGLKNTNNYLLFMLKIFWRAMTELKKTIDQESSKTEKKIYLPPRQEEIFNIIKDHRVGSFNFIKRRFLTVPSRTLRYDLKKLIDNKLIIKIGRTRGSFYRIP